MVDTILAIEYIVSTPGVLDGKPRIAGERVSVQNIVVLHEWHHWGVDQIASELSLTPAQIYAALSYYYDHKDEIDQSIIRLRTRLESGRGFLRGFEERI